MSSSKQPLADDNRVTTRFERDQLETLGEIADEYANRSEAIRDLLSRAAVARDPPWLECDPCERTRPIPRSLTEILTIAADAETVLEAHRRLGNSTYRTTETVLADLGFVDDGKLCEQAIRKCRATRLRRWYCDLKDGENDG
ncbi:hypothetical protein NP511_22120 (plasmid) [Natrinema thermotolerans]|uniref:Uncharacterized protein n=1 Tax=Natrinema thermotolerans TaxID=121872 RepID=A0AAF0T8F2_9EURY|nr:hypothetical protein [Natrinema thermotolerans]QCC57137.1 hypothetical protein DVR14_00230 [Natrinema thermotolerans]WMT10294.1 hypothetical protein NP511_22120 [Natrinema thermotolerans]